MTIRDNIVAQQTRAAQDPDFAAEIKNQAIAAIYSGIDDEDGAWSRYMSNFVDNPETPATAAQLARLTTTDEDKNAPYLTEARAYLVGNAVCFPGTTTGTQQGVTNLLDQ
jgi:hypothetical protein